jgi:hypothetical protein
MYVDTCAFFGLINRTQVQAWWGSGLLKPMTL